MAGASSNHNALPPKPLQPQYDAHGRAAMLLVESLIHGLIAQSIITVAGAIEIVEVAVDVSREIDGELDNVGSEGQRATTLLQAISKSLSVDFRGADQGD